MLGDRQCFGQKKKRRRIEQGKGIGNKGGFFTLFLVFILNRMMKVYLIKKERLSKDREEARETRRNS